MARKKNKEEQKIVQGYPLRDIYDYEGRGIAITEFIDGRNVVRRKIMVVEVEPISFALFSTSEKRVAIDKFYTLINSIGDKVSIQIHSFVKNKDLTEYINYIEDKARATFANMLSPKSEDFRRQYALEYTSWLKEQRSSERKYYIVLSTVADASADINLKNEAYHIISSLENAHVLNMNELMEFLYYVAHPGYDNLKFGPFVKYEEVVL